MKKEITVAEAVLEILEATGVDVCFGVPGGQTLPFYGAARARGFRHVMMHDERNTACAADAYARVTGRVGVCDATVGPGVTNLVSGLAEAFASSVPVIALIADIETKLEHMRHRSIVGQAMDQRPMLEPVTKWIGRLHKPEMIVDIMAHALRVATTGRAGPVAVEIPDELWAAKISNFDISSFNKSCSAWPRHRSAAPANLIAKAVDSIVSSQRPVVLAGGGAMASGAYKEIAAFANDFGIPIVTSMNAKGIIDEHHPLCHGVVGQFGNVNASHVLKQADTVLVFGSKFTEFNSFAWQMPEKSQNIIHIDIDGEELSRSIPVSLEIVSDVQQAAQQILSSLYETDKNFSWEVVGEAPQQPGTKEDDARIGPEVAVTMLYESFVGNTILVSDASLSSGWTSSRFKVRGAGRKFIAPRGVAGIGWACGAAVGAALAAPKDTRVLVVAGDGSAAYWLGEIETAVRLNLPITFMILNNSSFGWIVQVERAMGITQESTFSAVDFAAVGKALGGGGAQVTSIDEMRDGFKQASDCKGPFVLDVLSSEQSTATVPYELFDEKAAPRESAYSV
jgi:acetolactate synthase-1/2/3 large subunit